MLLYFDLIFMIAKSLQSSEPGSSDLQRLQAGFIHDTILRKIEENDDDR
jgi:hypothetical protein